MFSVEAMWSPELGIWAPESELRNVLLASALGFGHPSCGTHFSLGTYRKCSSWLWVLASHPQTQVLKNKKNKTTTTKKPYTVFRQTKSPTNSWALNSLHLNPVLKLHGLLTWSS